MQEELIKKISEHEKKKHLSEESKEKKRKWGEKSFLSKAKEKFGDRYDYSKVKYVDSVTHVEIVCPIHGTFKQIPRVHLRSPYGCPMCAHEKSNEARLIGTKKFVKEAKEIWKERNDYTNTVYEKYNKPLQVFCNIHQQPYMVHPYRHLHLGVGCPICSKEKFGKNRRFTQEEYIKKCREVHGDKYDYSKTIYDGNRNKVTITCVLHGDFVQNAANHLKGMGCPMCCHQKHSEEMKKSQEQFIADARKIHGDKYDYSLVEYEGCFTKVKIICPKHGIFEQTSSTHLKGCECPYCRKSKGEERVAMWLMEHDILFKSQHKLPNESILCKNRNIIVDFYLKELNTIIEYNGEQHYKPVDLWGGDEGFENQQERDMALRQYCKEHKIKLIEIPFSKFDKIEFVLSKELKRKKNGEQKK